MDFLQADEADDNPRYGDYLIQNPLGVGAFGKVFLAVDQQKKQYALKVSEACLNPTQIKNVQKESQNEFSLLKQCKHPNIIQIFDFMYCKEQKQFVLVLEYAGRGNLLNVLRKLKQPLNNEQMLKMVKQLSEGLKYLHTNKIMHRDLKLQNILVSQNGDLKIADFGISVQTALTQLTKETSKKGTYEYLAPESRWGGNFTFETDLYQLGIVIYLIKFGLEYELSEYNKGELFRVESVQEFDQFIEKYFKSKELNKEDTIVQILRGLLKGKAKDRMSLDQILLKIDIELSRNWTLDKIFGSENQFIWINDKQLTKCITSTISINQIVKLESRYLGSTLFWFYNNDEDSEKNTKEFLYGYYQLIQSIQNFQNLNQVIVPVVPQLNTFFGNIDQMQNGEFFPIKELFDQIVHLPIKVLHVDFIDFIRLNIGFLEHEDFMKFCQNLQLLVDLNLLCLNFEGDFYSNSYPLGNQSLELLLQTAAKFTKLRYFHFNLQYNSINDRKNQFFQQPIFFVSELEYFGFTIHHAEIEGSLLIYISNLIKQCANIKYLHLDFMLEDQSCGIMKSKAVEYLLDIISGLEKLEWLCLLLDTSDTEKLFDERIQKFRKKIKTVYSIKDAGKRIFIKKRRDEYDMIDKIQQDIEKEFIKQIK